MTMTPDEVLFHSRIHPEQRANALSDDEIATLHEKIVYVCKTAVDVRADSSKFPEGWLFPHRWVRVVFFRLTIGSFYPCLYLLTRGRGRKERRPR